LGEARGGAEYRGEEGFEVIQLLNRFVARRSGGEAGSTRSNVLIGVVVLGVLAAVAIFVVQGGDDDGGTGQAVDLKTDLATVRKAEEAHCAKNGRFGTEAELVNGGFLKQQSTMTDVVLASGGTCGTSTSSASQFLLTVQQPTEDSLTVGVNPQSSTADFTGAFTGTPAGVKHNFGMGPTNTNMFETLVRMTPDFGYEPFLAERWDAPGSFGGPANTWRFHLRHGVTFHNGTEMTAADAVYTFNNRIAPNTTLGVTATSAAAVPGDSYAVDVTLSFDNQRFLEQLTHHQTGAVVANGTVPWSSATAVPTPVGTGPFKFSSYAQGNELVLVRHDAYWGEKAKLRSLTFKFLADVNTRLLALQAGQIDMMFDLPPASADAVKGTQGLKVAVSPPGFNEVIWINSHRADDPGTANVREDALSDRNTTTAPLTDGNRVRKAIAAAINRAPIINAIYPSGAVTANSFVPAAILEPYASAIKGPAFDQGEANTQLNAAGWTCRGTCGPGNHRTKGGATLTVQLINGYTPTSLRGDSDILVENALEAVGIDVVRTRIGDTQQSTYDAEMLNGTQDLYMERISQNDANPASPPSSFFDCAGGTVGAGGTCPNSALSSAGYARWFADDVTPFAPTLAEARVAKTADLARKKTAEAMHYAVDDYVVGVHLGSLNSLFGMKSDVQGFLLHGSLRQVRWGSVYRLAS
jgi:peptide/nickel transport system substrate-binding protein